VAQLKARPGRLKARPGKLTVKAVVLRASVIGIDATPSADEGRRGEIRDLMAGVRDAMI
jgi:hypothetical protein